MWDDQQPGLFFRGGKPWLRYSVRLSLVGAILACGLIPYDHEVGGACRIVPLVERGVRAPIAGEIVSVYVKEGQWIEAGEPIAELSAREHHSSLAIAKAEADAARAELDRLRNGARPAEIAIAELKVQLWQVQSESAQRELSRVEDLNLNQAATEKELSDARRKHTTVQKLWQAAEEDLEQLKEGAREEEIRTAEARLAQAQEKIAHQQQQIRLANITAPVAGRIVSTNVEERLGQTLAAGDLIAVIHDDSDLFVKVAADEAAAVYVRPGMRTNVRLYANEGQLLRGTVERLGSRVADNAEFEIASYRTDREAHREEPLHEDDGQHVRIYVELDGPPTGLRPGMVGYARVAVGQDYLGSALLRPIVRFVRVDVWSWLP